MIYRGDEHNIFLSFMYSVCKFKFQEILFGYDQVMYRLSYYTQNISSNCKKSWTECTAFLSVCFMGWLLKLESILTASIAIIAKDTGNYSANQAA